jgi:hypothetical protein
MRGQQLAGSKRLIFRPIAIEAVTSRKLLPI